jgi:hypothetical protein
LGRGAASCGGRWMQASRLHWVTFCTRRKSPMAQATFSCRFAAIHLEKRMRGGFRFPPLMTLSLKRHKRGVRAPLGLPQGDERRETGTRGLRAVIPSGARNPPFGDLFYRRWRFFVACAPQNDMGFIHFASRASQHASKSHTSNARSAKAALKQCEYERHALQ